MFGIVFISKHFTDTHDLCTGKAQAGMKFGQLRKHISSQSIFECVRFDQHKRFFVFFLDHHISPKKANKYIYFRSPRFIVFRSKTAGVMFIVIVY